MLGAILGDIIGSVYEYRAIKTKDIELFVPRSSFTDDTVLTVAVADWILGGDGLGGEKHGGEKHGGARLSELLAVWAKRYPGRGYGTMFSEWIETPEHQPYGSYGNGSAMRVSPVGFAFDTMDEVLEWAERSAVVTHNHVGAIVGAKATAAAVLLARHGKSKNEIRKFIESELGYDLSERLDDIRPRYQFTEICEQTVPPALIAFLESTDYEDAIRNAVSLGGDADTIACITGGIAEAFYGGVPAELAARARALLDPQILDVVDRFRAAYSLV